MSNAKRKNTSGTVHDLTASQQRDRAALAPLNFLPTFKVGNLHIKPRAADGCEPIGQINTLTNLEKMAATNLISGPAGTGKTLLAIAVAACFKEHGYVTGIGLARPAVEAGENLGFLPGTAEEKLDPYMRPLYDELTSVYGNQQLARLLNRQTERDNPTRNGKMPVQAEEDPERGTVEINTLAHMRGRTIKNSVFIVDEAQNATYEQMRMLMTRQGEGTMLIVTGDPTQSDLPSHQQGAFKRVVELFEARMQAQEKNPDMCKLVVEKPEIAFYNNRVTVSHMGENDIVRAPAVTGNLEVLGPEFGVKK